jgi:hypothetical protein
VSHNIVNPKSVLPLDIEMKIFKGCAMMIYDVDEEQSKKIFARGVNRSRYLAVLTQFFAILHRFGAVQIQYLTAQAKSSAVPTLSFVIRPKYGAVQTLSSAIQISS